MSMTRTRAERVKITPRQAEVMDFIESYFARHGMAPSHREIGAALRVSSMNAVTSLIKRLRDKGRLDWDPNTARSLRIRGRSSIMVDDSIRDEVLAFIDELMSRRGREGT